MTITNVNPGAFANGYDYFCPNCGEFFSVQFEPDIIKGVKLTEYCPCCGDDFITSSVDDLLLNCITNNTDPVNFYHAFPMDEPIPRSRTGATPRQVKIIESMVILNRQAKRMVTVDSIAAEADIPREIVEKVFEELHITESGVAA